MRTGLNTFGGPLESYVPACKVQTSPHRSRITQAHGRHRRPPRKVRQGFEAKAGEKKNKPGDDHQGAEESRRPRCKTRLWFCSAVLQWPAQASAQLAARLQVPWSSYAWSAAQLLRNCKRSLRKRQFGTWQTFAFFLAKNQGSQH